jgi:predicted aldo/keto reductase-like oxidoreductase
MNRRDFVKFTAGAALASKFPAEVSAQAGQSEIPRRTLGKTGEKVSVIGLGGYHLGVQKDENESIRLIRTALDRGINFLDNCWDYNDGTSEVRMGKALRDGYRQKAFLMTKIDGRDKATAAKQIEESLKRLQTDHVDLMQIHENIRMSDSDRVFADDGAIHALLDARKAGKIRYIGFTGHKNPEVHLKMLKVADAHGFSFDTVQMPLNVMDAHYESFEKKVLPVALAKKMGILGMKPIGDKIILESKTVSATECLHYAMHLPTSVVITGCDSMPILEQALQAAQSFRPMNEKEVATLLAKTAPAAMAGKFELYKTSHEFDGTYQNPQWLGPGAKKETYPAA